MARKYNRDSNGRFASGGGSTSGRSRPAASGGRGPRGGKVGTRAQQRRAAREQAARSAAFSSKATTGREARAAWKSAAGAARAARGGPANGIRSLSRPGQRPMGLKASGIRPYTPVTERGKQQKAERGLTRAISNIKAGLADIQQGSGKRRQLLNAAEKLQLRSARITARDIARSKESGTRGRISRLVLSSSPGSALRDGRDVIRRRAARATAAAARGSKAGARAREIYGQQLAFTGTGKPSSAQSSIRPGPRNTKGTPKRKRKSRKPKS